MNDTEKFLFDLQGFIVVRDFLSQREVKTLNDAFDANWDQRREDPIGDPSGNMAGRDKRGLFTDMLTWEQPHCRPFRDLLAHPKLLPLSRHPARARLEARPRAVHAHRSARASRGCASTAPPTSSTMARASTRTLTARCAVGLLVVQYALHDQNPGDGGLCVIAGSHKANFSIARGRSRPGKSTRRSSIRCR